MSNVYYSPESYGLTVVGTAYDDSREYEFDMFAVWRDTEGNYLWASDAGCSCPEPFEAFALDDLDKGSAMQAHAALNLWGGTDPGKSASTAELHLAIARAG